jgi:amino acid transporter
LLRLQDSCQYPDFKRTHKPNQFHRILGLIVDFGGSPNHDFIGGRFWHDPGPCNNGLSGFLTVVNIASFAYGGTEMTGLNAAETANPDKDLPKALKRVFWRIAIVRAILLTLAEYLANFK